MAQCCLGTSDTSTLPGFIIEWYQNRDLAQQQLHDAISQALLTSSLSQIESQIRKKVRYEFIGSSYNC